MDLLGFGVSDKTQNADYSIELFAQLPPDFIQAMYDDETWVSDKQWIVAGNSSGGLCSLGAAEQLPDLVRAVVLFNCAGGMTGFRYEDVPIILGPLLYFLQRVVLGPSLGGRFFANF